jgi:signal transduction histidine kinase
LNRRSLTFRLGAWYCGLLLLISGSFAAFAYIGFTYYLRSTVRATLETRAKDVTLLATPLIDDLPELSIAMGKRFAPEAHDRFMRITVDGKTVYRSGQPVSGTFDSNTIDTDIPVGTSLENRGAMWIYSTTSPLSDERSMVIEAGELDDKMADARRGLIRALLIAMPVLLFVAAAGGYWLVRRALTPVAGMINAAEALTFNSPHKRLPLAGTDDVLDDLVKTLNRMLDRLDHAYQHANRFSADAAHELRTPLAIMRGELEFIAPRRDLVPEVAAAAVSALDETVRLVQLVENLMNLAVIEGTGGKRAHRPVDLRALAAETIEQMKLLAVDKRIELTWTEGPPVLVLGDRDRLKQALVNLIDNAIKYTPSGGSVALDVLAHGESARLTVTDTGIGITSDHQVSIFDRFFRVDPDRGIKGAGLGLAIIKSICIAHGGSIVVDSVPLRGSTFIVDLPLAPDVASPTLNIV